MRADILNDVRDKEFVYRSVSEHTTLRTFSCSRACEFDAKFSNRSVLTAADKGAKRGTYRPLFGITAKVSPACQPTKKNGRIGSSFVDLELAHVANGRCAGGLRLGGLRDRAWSGAIDHTTSSGVTRHFAGKLDAVVPGACLPTRDDGPANGRARRPNHDRRELRKADEDGRN